MKNKLIFIVLIIVGVIVAGGTLFLRRQGERDEGNGSSDIVETDLEYEDLNTNILGLIAEVEGDGSNATQPGDVLSIELFEVDPENEKVGEIH